MEVVSFTNKYKIVRSSAVFVKKYLIQKLIINTRNENAQKSLKLLYIIPFKEIWKINMYTFFDIQYVLYNK